MHIGIDLEHARTGTVMSIKASGLPSTEGVALLAVDTREVVAAIAVSMLLHVFIMYTPPVAKFFTVTGHARHTSRLWS